MSVVYDSSGKVTGHVATLAIDTANVIVTVGVVYM